MRARCAASLAGSAVTTSACLQAFRAVGVFHQFGNPDGFPRLVLTGENPQPSRRFRDRPLKDPELGRRQAAVRHRHRPLEIGRAERLVAARANFLGAGGRIDRREGDAFDAFAAFCEKCARRSIMFCFDQHAEQFHIVGVEHDGVIARSHLGAVRAARRHREAEPLPVLGGLVEIPHHDDGVIDSDDVLECHSFVSPA